MKHSELGRRRLLLSTAGWVAGLAAVTLVRPARALQLEDVELSSPLGLAYSERCGPPSQHTALEAQLRLLLDEDPARNTASATCPLCGCPVIVSR